MSNRSPNFLINETSPYLLQHAYNPVQWFPWGNEALEKAREVNKPILLSIGYSACHWCHVMAHESFEDQETADMMNELFINIKVDREERPDLDKIYQLAHQLLTRRGGGWPLTMFLSPVDHTPFFGGTYFPKEARYGLPAFKNIMQIVAEFYRDKPDQLEQQNQQLNKYLSQLGQLQPIYNKSINDTPLTKCRKYLEAEFDQVNAGFGGAPKFPNPTYIEFLLQYWHASKTSGKEDRYALLMSEATLQAMALGGVYDQLGGGFYRYSVDTEWMIPHFEKMLYDNGQLLAVYANAWQATGNIMYKRVLTETAEWVMREMQAEAGGYFSTLDADSENVEGKFYYWNKQEIKQQLTEEEYKVFSMHFGLNHTPNFEAHWHLYVDQSLTKVAKKNQLLPEQAQALLRSAKNKLFKLRQSRTRPGRDEKILTSWNGLMIKGMALAGRSLQRSDFIDSAEKALQFIIDKHWVEGRLLATSKDGHSHLNAYLDDYVFLADGVLSLLQVRWSTKYFQFAIEVVDAMLEHFATDGGGFYFTANDHESLLHRPRPLMDEAMPAGNAVAAQVLLQLGHLLGESCYLDAAENTIRAAWQEVERIPHAHCAMLIALDRFLKPPQTVIVRGKKAELDSWKTFLDSRFEPGSVKLLIPGDERGLPTAINNYHAPENGVLAYVCRAGTCLPPVNSIDDYVKVGTKTPEVVFE